MADGDYFGTEEPWKKHLNSTKQYETSNCLDLVTAEDLVPAGHGYAFDAMRSEWAFEVIGSEGFPRKVLGIMVIKATWDGKLVTTVE